MNLDWELCELSQKHSVLSQQKGNTDISLFPRMRWLCLTPTYHQVLHLISTESLKSIPNKGAHFLVCLNQQQSLVKVFSSQLSAGTFWLYKVKQIHN